MVAQYCPSSASALTGAVNVMRGFWLTAGAR